VIQGKSLYTRVREGLNEEVTFELKLKVLKEANPTYNIDEL
jgi:hypothetical protein